MIEHWMARRVSRLGEGWTSIAWRPRHVSGAIWTNTSVLLDTIEARQCVDCGLLLMATRYRGDTVECVVRPAK